MNNIIYIRIPFVSVISTYNITDNYSFVYSISGSYSPVPFGNDNFDLYVTGTGNNNGQLFFSGSGFWNGSGYTINNVNQFYDAFDSYQTGLISGYGVSIGGITGIMLTETGLNSGINISGYNYSQGLFGYMIWSGYL